MDSSVANSSSANQVYFKGPYIRQNWTLPDSIIYYISKNPKSPKCYQKMIQSCKYFFSKNLVIVCSDLNFYAKENESQIEIEIKHDGENKYIALKDFSQSFWITDILFSNQYIGNYDKRTIKENVMSSLIPNIYQCDIKKLRLCKQNISLNELLFLASKADDVDLRKCTINNNEDGFVIPFEKIIEAFVHARTFYFEFNENDPSISSKTVENLIKISHLSSIKEIGFIWISEVFDIETFYNYMKKNKHTFFWLVFDDTISVAYQIRVEEIVDEILATENRDYKPPMIYFSALDVQKYDELYRLCFYKK